MFTMTTEDAFCTNISTHFGDNGRTLLSALLSKLDLSRDDTITILTTSNDIYVSSCVSLTCFNYAAISREIVDNTKVVLVIHEHGYCYPDMAALRAMCDDKGIVLIEDCAHVIGAKYPDGSMVGTYGHHTLFSLPKLFPMNKGGMLLSPLNISTPSFDPSISKDFETYYPYWQSFNQARIDRLKVIENLGCEVLFPSDLYVPWFVRVRNSVRPEGNIEFGATLRSDILLIPTNPLVPIDFFENLAFKRGAF
jgi:hypothetical protein